MVPSSIDLEIPGIKSPPWDQELKEIQRANSGHGGHGAEHGAEHGAAAVATPWVETSPTANGHMRPTREWP